MKTRFRIFLLCLLASGWCSQAQPVAPFIITQPQDQAVNPGESPTFSVTAGGTEPLSYQWQNDGYVVQAATDPSLTVTAPSWMPWWLSRYSVTVTNVAGAVTSRTAMLTAPPLPYAVKPAGYSWPVPGYLQDFSDTISAHFTFLPIHSWLVKLDPTPSYGAIHYTRVSFGVGWSPAIPTPPEPGYGWFIREDYSDYPLFFRTNLPPPVLPLDLPPGFSLVCCQYPRDASFEEIVGRPPDLGTRVYRSMGTWSPLWPTNIEGTAFLTYAFTNGSWAPSPPLVPLGEAVWVLQPPKVPTPQIVAGQLQFPIRTATFATMDLEYSDSLDSSSSWQLLAPIVGSGNVTNVVDDLATNGAPRRYYRLNLKPGLP